MLIILVNGKINAGKGFVSRRLNNLFIENDQHCTIEKFAEPLKKMMGMFFDIKNYLGDECKTEEIQIDFDKANILTFGQIQQKVGEGFKDIFGRHFWGFQAFKKLEKLEKLKYDVVIFDDFRFPEELHSIEQFVKRNNQHVFKTLKIETDRNPEDRKDNRDNKHISQTALKDFEFDNIIVNNENTSFKEIEKNLKEIYKKFLKDIEFYE